MNLLDVIHYITFSHLAGKCNVSSMDVDLITFSKNISMSYSSKSDNNQLGFDLKHRDFVFLSLSSTY